MTLTIRIRSLCTLRTSARASLMIVAWRHLTVNVQSLDISVIRSVAEYWGSASRGLNNLSKFRTNAVATSGFCRQMMESHAKLCIYSSGCMAQMQHLLADWGRRPCGLNISIWNDFHDASIESGKSKVCVAEGRDSLGYREPRADVWSQGESFESRRCNSGSGNLKPNYR